MPQGRRKYADFDQLTGGGTGGKYSDFGQVVGTQPKPAPMMVEHLPGPEQPAPGFLENLQTGIARGVQKYAVDPFLAIGEAVENAKTGNYVPAAQIAELAGRGALTAISAFDPTGAAYEPTAAEQEPAIAQIQQQQEARRAGNAAFQANRRRELAIREQEARDQSLGGRITRGAASLAVGAIPAVLTGIATGGSLPAIAGVTALQSAAQPENLALNVGGAVTPIPLGKLVAPILRRIRGIQGAESGAAEAFARPGQGGTQIVNLQGRGPVVPEVAGAATQAQPSFINLTGMGQAIGENFRKALRDSVEATGRLPRAEAGSSIDRAFESLVTAGAPRDAVTLELALQRVAQDAISQPSPSLAKAIGQDAFDDTKVAVEDLGLAHVPQPTRPANAYPVSREIPVEDITLSRDNLSRGRMFQAEEALKNGVQAERKGVPLAEQIEPIQVVPDPQNPGKFIVQGDGNHRVALLKLQGNNELIPVKSFETEAQSAVVNEATASLRENYYNAPMEMPTLGEGGFEAPSLSVSYGEPKRYPGAAGPRITEQGFVEGSNPGVVKPEERTGILKTLVAAWKAGLLTRPNTHLKNIGFNAGFALSEEAARIPGAIADMIVSPIFGGGRRAFAGPSAGAMARSLKEAFTKGLSQAKQVIKNGVSEADAEALALKELNSPSKVLNTYVNGVFRLLSAEDKVARVYATRRFLEERASLIARNEYHAGQIAKGQVGERTRELIQNPPEALAAAVAADTEIAVFTNPNLVSGAVSSVHNFLQTTKIPGGKLADVGVEMTLPFPKTPSNVIGKMIEYAGGGYLKNIYQLGKGIANKAMTEGEQRAFSQSFGRATTGVGLIVLGSKLYKAGLMTGYVEDDPSRKARDEAAGRIPGAVLIDGTWHQVVGTSPFGNLMVMGATIQRESDQERDDALKAYLEAGAQFVGEQPLMQGARQLAGPLNNPGTFASRTLGGFASGFVPGIVADVAQLGDTQRRQTDTVLRQIENRIPGLRNTLPPKPDVLGQPVPLAFPFDPTKSTTAQEATNPLFAELVRLDHGISGFEKKKDETDEQHAEKVSTFGQLYAQYGLTLINSQPYQSADDATRKELFDLLNHRVKSVVTENEERFAQAKLSPAIIYQAFRESELRKRQKALQRRTP